MGGRAPRLERRPYTRRSTLTGRAPETAAARAGTGHPRAALRCPAFRGCLSTRGNTAESAPPLAPLLAVGTSAGYWAVAKGDLSLPAPLRHLKTFGSPPLVTPPDAPLQATPAETALPPIRSRSSMALAAPRLSQPSRAITAASRALRKQAAPSPTVPGPQGRAPVHSWRKFSAARGDVSENRTISTLGVRAAGRGVGGERGRTLGFHGAPRRHAGGRLEGQARPLVQPPSACPRLESRCPPPQALPPPLPLPGPGTLPPSRPQALPPAPRNPSPAPKSPRRSPSDVLALEAHVQVDKGQAGVAPQPQAALIVARHQRGGLAVGEARAADPLDAWGCV